MVDKITPDMEAPISITYGDLFKIYLLFGNLNSTLFKEKESLWMRIKEHFDPCQILYDDEIIEWSTEYTVENINRPEHHHKLKELFEEMFNKNLKKKERIKELKDQIQTLELEKQVLEHEVAYFHEGGQ